MTSATWQSSSPGAHAWNPPAKSPVKPEEKKPQAWVPTTDDTIYLRNIPPSLTEKTLRGKMNRYGPISFIDFPVTPQGTPVGYAYVRFEGPYRSNACKNSQRDYHDTIMDNYRLEVGLY